ncbi:MAG: TolC family protein [Gemmatimonadaceae bacterium]
MAIQVRASEIRHPLVPALSVNLSDGLSPDEAALLAVAANPKLRLARARRGVAQAQLIAAGVLPNPQFAGGMDRPAADSTRAVTGTSLGAAVDLLGFVTRGAARDAAQRRLQSIDLGLAWQEWQVAESARLRTYGLMLVETALSLAADQEREMETTVATLRSAVRQQLATKVELGAADVAYRATVDAHLALGVQRDTALVALAQLLGIDRASMPRIERTPVPFDAPSASLRGPDIPTLAMMTRDLGSRRLDLQGLRMGYLSQEAQVRASVLRQFPRVSIGVNRNRDTGNLQTLGGVVSILFPLFDRNQGEMAVTRATRSELRAEYDARVTDARATIEALLVQVSAGVQRLQNRRTSIAMQEATVDLYRRAFQNGNADVLTYYVAWGDLMNRRLDAIAAQHELVALAIALETAAGLHFIVPAR